MSWAGTMICNITNSTGGSITKLTFSHQWNESVDEPIVNPNQPIADGDSFPLTIHVGEGGTDLWSVQFTDSQGNCWYRNQKQCDIEQEDFDSGNPVKALLGPGNLGFSIMMPVSSSCTDNYYDSCNDGTK